MHRGDARGLFLTEVAAVARANATRGLVPARLRFGDGDHPVVAVTAALPGTPPHTAHLPVTTDRTALTAVLAAVLGPLAPPSDPVGDPAAHPSPPLAVHAELLGDLGGWAVALTTYGPRAFVYTEIATDGATYAHVDVRDATGTCYRTVESLTATHPPVATPHSIVDWIVAGKGHRTPSGLVVFDRQPFR
ncbi:hypothetical protein [Saccharothrix espanaensis]|uniref:hypothetical protein n=1 Tax=Saccharothrix espanaensis TaxID=103731 RepID=UPI00130DE513|nr:hypothetical protein [Saccharothrix espanaensis]